MDKKIINTLDKIKEEKLDTKICKIQLDKLYYSKYSKNFNINIKKYNDVVLVYGIIFKQGISKPIKFNYNVFKYLLEKKNDIYSWISKYNNYNVEKKTNENQDENQDKNVDENQDKNVDDNQNENQDEDENKENKISTFDIFTLLINDFNNNLIIKIDADQIKSFEHDEIYPYHIRYNNFYKLMNNIVKINKLIDNY